MEETDQNQNVDDGTLAPVESPETERGRLITAPRDPEAYTRALEKMAEYSMRIRKAQMQLIVAKSFPSDWVDFDGAACLTSAGAERYFSTISDPNTGMPMKIKNMTRFPKHEWEDEIGKAYSFTYACNLSLGEIEVYAEGTYSTRHKFHGYIGGKDSGEGRWKELHEINEAYIQSAARHICIGNAVKTALGLRGIKTDYLKKMIDEMGGDPSIIKGVTFDKGAKGGKTATPDDDKKQHELWALLSEMNNGSVEDAKEQIINLSSFTGKDGKEKYCDSIKRLTGKWLNNTLGKAKKAHAEWKAVTNGEDVAEGDDKNDELPY